MISRVAEHCFWMARYLERAENTARLLEVNRTLLLDFHVPAEQQWLPLLIISGIHDYEKDDATAELVQAHMTWNAENPFSIVSSLAWARENARIIREVISAEMWERMNFYHLWLRHSGTRAQYDGDRTEFYAQIRRINQLLHGIADDTMSHGEAWEFFRIGKHLERACQTARVLDVKYHTLLPSVADVGSPIDNAHWVAILRSCSGYEPFHKNARYAAADPGTAVAEFLIYEEDFPRSVRHCFAEARRSLDAVGRPSGVDATDADRRLDAMLLWLETRTIHDLIAGGLHESLTLVVDSIHALGEAVHDTYFTGQARPVARQTQSQSQSGQTQTQSQS